MKKVLACLFRILNNIFFKNKYLIINKNEYGVYKLNEKATYNIHNFGIYDKEREAVYKKHTQSVFERAHFLKIPKNKYVLCERKDMEYQLLEKIENNTFFYNEFWADGNYIKNYEDKAREGFYFFVSQVVLNNISQTKIELIDIGVGSGKFIEIFESQCKSKDILIEITGTDISLVAVNRLQQKFPEFYFMQADILSTYTSDKLFDIVCCMEVLEHIEFPQKALNFLSAVCKENGIIVISIPNGAIDDYHGHTNFWTMQNFINILIENNLEVFYSAYCDYFDTSDYFMIFLCKKKRND